MRAERNRRKTKLITKPIKQNKWRTEKPKLEEWQSRNEEIKNFYISENIVEIRNRSRRKIKDGNE